MPHHRRRTKERAGLMFTTQRILAGALMLPFLALAGCNKPPADRHAAQTRGVYDPRETFAPLSLPSPVNAYRSGDGTPGPDYWQNRADYKIAATVDPAKAMLSGAE